MSSLPFIFYLVLGFAICMYVILDGFDLGLGILYPWFRSQQERDHMMRAVAPVWDGNETWLVFGGVILFAAFPAAYAQLLSTLYVPIVIMLLALVFRGVAFEYRFKSHRSLAWWDLAFSAGSTVATLCQGLMLGTVIQGLNHATPESASIVWLSPFAIFTAFALMAGYALLACSFLVIKTREAMTARAAQLGRRLVWLVLGAMAIVSLWSVIDQPLVRERWFGGYNFVWLWPLPLLALFLGIKLYRDLGDIQHEHRPFTQTVLIFITGFAGLVVGLFPYVVPHQLTLWDAHSPDSSLTFVLVGVVILVPVILSYTVWGYRVFSGKVEDMEEGY